jgi:hypothetical protein
MKLSKELHLELNKISAALTYYEHMYYSAKDKESKKIWLMDIKQTKKEHLLFYKKNMQL